MKNNTITIAAMSAAVVITFGTSVAQKPADYSNSMDRQNQERSSTSSSSGRTDSADDYSVLVWDPITNAWVYIADLEANRQAADQRSQDPQARRSQQQQTRQDREQSRATVDRWPDNEEWSDTMEDRRSDSREAEDRQAARQDRRSARISGTIDGFRKVNLKRGEDMPEEHTWVRVRLEDGTSKVVDLGRKKDLEDLNLERGKHIRVSGRQGSISGQETLLADTIRIGNETYNIDRNKRRQQVTGIISDYERVRLEGTDRKDHLVVKLELESGKEVTADLGRSGSLSELQLQRDKPVKLQGERRQINGRSVLVVNKITHVGTQQLRD